MLQENTSLQSLNVESNFITSDGMMSIMKAMANNATLVELKIDNQVKKKKLPAKKKKAIALQTKKAKHFFLILCT